MRTWFSVVAAGICCLFLSASMANAASIYACKKKNDGTIRIVGAKKVCLATETKISWPDAARVAALEARVTTSEAQVAVLQTLVTTSQAQVAALEDLLQHFSRNGSDTSITGANLWIKNGSGVTNSLVSGIGNLIVGYNELRGGGQDDRSGSHNIIVGKGNNYTYFGGFVAGTMNTISGEYSTVSGGSGNTADGWYSSISGGNGNFASNDYASVSGGSGNNASGEYSSVSGGANRLAWGVYDWVAGTLLQDQ